ncbi:MAG: zinc metalloprotease HtpX, partial [Chloroflexi bacterium]|nr:zinc metalloprotease HtpX [Chloroflexota bacterium]
LYAVFALVLVSFGVPIVFMAGIVGVMVVVQFFLSDKMVLWSTGAKEVSPAEEPQLHAMVQRLAVAAGIPKPRVAIMKNSIPNAFATGRNPRNALVAVTTGLRERLNDREIEAVLAHELAHVVNRDIRVLAIANFFVMVTSFLMTMLFWNMLFGGMGGRRNNQAGAMMLIYLITMVVYFLGQLLVLALTRYREYGADHGGAVISGNPSALASALEKISGSMARIPQEDLRKVQTANAFMIIPAAAGGSMQNLFSTHPPVEDRVRRLREMERQMRYGGA